MTCYGARCGYYSKEVNPVTGLRPIVFDVRKSNTGVAIMIPCGECVGCRLAWRRAWAIRCMHEKRMYSASAFVTLTYDDKHIPEFGSLRLRDLQLFMKKLRLVRPSGLRFFACGEYGGQTHRPHYHLLLFNTDFPDMRYLKDSGSGCQLFRSKELSDLWALGNCDIGNVDYRSACYVAGYVSKKIGVVVDYGVREPEFRVMSRRPGIGLRWYEKYHVEAYRHDSAIMNGREVSLPRYYDTKFVIEDADRMLKVKRARRRLALFSHREELTKERMFVREQVELKKLAFWYGGR